MPIDVNVYRDLLLQTNYDREKTEFLVHGFTEGFDLGFEGPLKRQDRSRNIPFTVDDKFDMWEKIMIEVRAGRYAGPFDHVLILVLFNHRSDWFQNLGTAPGSFSIYHMILRPRGKDLLIIGHPGICVQFNTTTWIPQLGHAWNFLIEMVLLKPCTIRRLTYGMPSACYL